MKNQKTIDITAEFDIQKFNDVWLDNGLATFSKIIKRLNGDDEEDIVEKVNIGPLDMNYSFNNKHEFTKLLSNTIKDKIKDMIVKVEDKNTGEKKRSKKRPYTYSREEEN